MLGSAGGSMKMRDKRRRNNFIKMNGLFEKFKELIFVISKFILESVKLSAQESCLCGII